MKQKRYIWAMVAVLAMSITGCAKFEPVPEGTGVLTEAEADALQPVMSIREFKHTFDKKDTLFSINYIDTESDLYIRGRIITTDESGNIYKYLIIQDTETGDALKVSVDAGSLSGALPLGQEIAINCKGLVLGRYADMPQLGVEAFNDEKLRVEPGRIPYHYFCERLKVIGAPDESKIIVKDMTIAELLAADESIYGQLVRLKNVHFTGLGDDGEKLKDADKIFAPSTFNGTYNIGYPQSRQIADANGNVAYISTSEYARFAETALPATNKWGAITAIAGYYQDKVDRAGEIQLTIRTLKDLDGFFGEGGGETPDTPVEPVDAILDVKFTDGLGNFTTYNVLGEQVWSSDSKYGAKMSGFAGGASHANEDWLISPALDLSGKSGVVITFEHAINKGNVANLKTNHTLLMSDNYSEGNPQSATWQEVPITVYPDGTSWTYVSSGDIVVPAEYLKANVRFAFKYMCSDRESATWEMKNLIVK